MEAWEVFKVAVNFASVIADMVLIYCLVKLMREG